MKNFFLLLIVFSLSSFFARAQKNSSDSIFLIQLNQQIEEAVVKQDTALLSRLYADDFVFSHGTGNVDNKTSWLRAVAKGGFISRKHDSVSAELHQDIAILRGKLNVQKKTAIKTDNYFVKYVRVYVKRNERWQMISHFTFYEQHEK